MSFYSSPQLSSGNSWEAIFGDTVIIFSLAAGWSNTSDNTSSTTIYITLDEGVNWIEYSSDTFYYGSPQYTYIGNYSLPINGIKFTVTTAAEGNTFAVIVTGK